MSEKKEPLVFKLGLIKTENFALVELPDENQDNVELITKISFTCPDQSTSVLVAPRFTFQKNGTPFLDLEVACIFDLDQKSWDSLINPENGIIIIPKGFAAHLAAVAVGVARGVMHAKTEGTTLNSYVIPLINVKEGIPEDVQFQNLQNPEKHPS